MPVEIRELIIRAVVDDANGSAAPAPSPASGDDRAASQAASDSPSQAQVEACVRAVLAVLDRRRER